ncbi:MAG: hypothetical protein ACKVZ6_23410 [Kineosporiaceae bacterium]|jgi:hypothetical protein
MTTPVQHRPRGRRRGRRPEGGRRRTTVIALPLALVASSALVYQASNAAFTASTSNGSNTWSSGTVLLADDDSSSVMFQATNIKPGSTGIKCINVTYSGTLAGQVRLYVTSPSGTLGQYLDLAIEEGTGAAGGASLSCSGFSAGSTITAGGETLASFATAHTDFASGVSAWAPTGVSSEARSYRVTYTLQDDNAAQNKSAAATFTWEARNT